MLTGNILLSDRSESERKESWLMSVQSTGLGQQRAGYALNPAQVSESSEGLMGVVVFIL